MFDTFENISPANRKAGVHCPSEISDRQAQPPERQRRRRADQSHGPLSLVRRTPLGWVLYPERWWMGNSSLLYAPTIWYSVRANRSPIIPSYGIEISGVRKSVPLCLGLRVVYDRER